jgi:hypothetical protein
MTVLLVENLIASVPFSSFKEEACRKDRGKKWKFSVSKQTDFVT